MAFLLMRGPLLIAAVWLISSCSQEPWPPCDPCSCRSAATGSAGLRLVGSWQTTTLENLPEDRNLAFCVTYADLVVESTPDEVTVRGLDTPLVWPQPGTEWDPADPSCGRIEVGVTGLPIKFVDVEIDMLLDCPDEEDSWGDGRLFRWVIPIGELPPRDTSDAIYVDPEGYYSGEHGVH